MFQLSTHKTNEVMMVYNSCSSATLRSATVNKIKEVPQNETSNSCKESAELWNCKAHLLRVQLTCVYQLYSDGEGTCTQTSYVVPITLIQNDQWHVKFKLKQVMQTQIKSRERVHCLKEVCQKSKLNR